MPGSREPVLPTAVNLVGGEVREPRWLGQLAHDPNTGEERGPRAHTSIPEVEGAVERAHAGWAHGAGTFSSLATEARLEQLERFASALEARTERFAHVHAAETGVPIAVASLFAGGLAGIVRGVAAAAPAILEPQRLDVDTRHVELTRAPWGPAALYPTWNGAAFLAVTKLSYALAAGCPAVLKPSEHAQATTGVLVDALLEAELHPDSVQVVCGGPEVGAQLASDSRIRMISYTGGTAGGRAIAAAAIGRMATMQLELGASNPAVVLSDADLDQTAGSLADAMLVLNGQWCEAPRRVYVPRASHDELVELVLEQLASRTIGHALEAETDIGPLAHRRHFEAVQAATARLGRRGRASRSHDELPRDGFFVSPTVVGDLALDAVDGEIFGPVLAVCPFDDPQDAIRAANGLGDGLAAYVYGRDVDAARSVGRRLQAGEIRLNGAHVLDLAAGSAQSFWGTSGLGGHGTAEVLSAHLGLKVIGEDDPALPL